MHQGRHRYCSTLVQVMTFAWRHQAISWTNDDMLTGPLTTILREIWIKIWKFSFKKMDSRILPAKWQPFCFILNVSSSPVTNSNQLPLISWIPTDLNIITSITEPEDHRMITPLLTLNVQGPSYLGLTRSISWQLMPWLLTSPGHQQSWYWLYSICRSLSYLRKNFKYLCHINVEEWHKMYVHVYVHSEKFST